jgi:hypothetical protein
MEYLEFKLVRELIDIRYKKSNIRYECVLTIKYYNLKYPMFKLVIVGTIAAFTLAKEHPINADMIHEIKQKASTW